MKKTKEIKYADMAWELEKSNLPQDELIAKLQELVRQVERHILNVTGPDPINNCRHDWLKGNTGDMNESEEYRLVDELLLDRMVILNILFRLHCNDAEIDRFKLINNHLYGLTKELFRKTADTYRMMLMWPRDDHFTDDVNIDGSITYECESETNFMRLEDDAFYCSDFGQMLAVISATENDNRPDIVSAFCQWNPEEDNAKMSDKELGIENHLDDGESWVEGFQYFPQLDDTCICYAVHDICTHRSYSIPDLLRMNDFTAQVKVEIQNIRETDGSRFRWCENCTKEQFVEKFLKESEHRPKDMSISAFLWKRLNGYYGKEYLESQGIIIQRPAFKSKEKAAEYLSDFWTSLQKSREQDN